MLYKGMKERRTRNQEKRKKKRRKETGEDGKGEGREGEVVSALNVGEVVSVAYSWFIGRENFTRTIFLQERTDFIWKNASVSSYPLRTWLSRRKVFRAGKDILNETRGGILPVCLLKGREVMVVVGRRTRDGERMGEGHEG